MKSFIKIFVTMLLMVVGATAFASPVFDVKSIDNKSFVLYLQEKEAGDVKIRLQDRRGLVLLRENVQDASKFAKKYNLRALVSGEYSLVIENETTVRIQPIIVSSEKLDINVLNQKTIIKPMIRRLNEKVEIVMSVDEKTWTEMYIFDQDGHTLFKEATNHTKAFRRRFDISQLEPGKYVFKVVANDIYVRETIIINKI